MKKPIITQKLLQELLKEIKNNNYDILQLAERLEIKIACLGIEFKTTTLKRSKKRIKKLALKTKMKSRYLQFIHSKHQQLRI